MSGTEAKRSWKTAPGWLKLLLVVSLLGNAAVAGLASGWMARDGRTPNEPGLNRQQTRMLLMVPEPRREEARQILLAGADEMAAARETVRAAQTALLDALRAEPFSAERLAQAMEARQAASGAMRGLRYLQLGEIAARLDAAERAELADAMEERYRRWMERRDGKK